MTEVSARLGGAGFRGEILDLPADGKGHDVNLVTDGFIGVADGSTPLVDDSYLDARGYAQEVLMRLVANRTDDLVELFRRALTVPTAPDVALSKRASCTVAVLIDAGERIAAGVLGDCIVVLRAADGTDVVVRDRRLERFDGSVAQKMARDMAGGMSADEAQQSATAELISNRDRANSEETYWLFADDPRAADHVVSGFSNLVGVEQIFVCSDGFSRLIDPFGVARDASELVSLASTRGLAVLGRELRQRESAPASLIEYPRLDESDDATALLLRRSD